MTAVFVWLVMVADIVMVLGYFWPGLVALRFWTQAKRDEQANHALIARRERR